MFLAPRDLKRHTGDYRNRCDMMIRGPITPTTLLSTHHVAAMLLVDPKTIIHWTQRGILAVAFTPGGHRRIQASQVLDFVRG